MNLLIKNWAKIGSLLDGYSLHWACWSNIPEIVEVMIGNGANLNPINEDYFFDPNYVFAFTPLHTQPFAMLTP